VRIAFEFCERQAKRDSNDSFVFVVMLLLPNPQQSKQQTGPSLWQRQQQCVVRLDSVVTVAVVGDPGSGKSTLIAALCNEKERNIGGAEYIERNANNSVVVQAEGRTVKYNFLEMDGDKMQLQRACFPSDSHNSRESSSDKHKLDAILILFDVTSPASLEAARAWLPLLKRLNLDVAPSNYILLGSFGDKNSDRPKPELLRQLAYLCSLPAPLHYCECSAIQDWVEFYPREAIFGELMQNVKIGKNRDSIAGFFGRLVRTIDENRRQHEVDLHVEEVMGVIVRNEYVHPLLVAKLERDLESRKSYKTVLYWLAKIEVHQPKEFGMECACLAFFLFFVFCFVFVFV
jgi:GTPase SAR1 family protein